MHCQQLVCPSYARARSVGVAGLGRRRYGGCIAPEPVSSSISPWVKPSIAPWVKPCVFLNCSVGKTLCLCENCNLCPPLCVCIMFCEKYFCT